jgi:hypothetical protein
MHEMHDTYYMIPPWSAIINYSDMLVFLHAWNASYLLRDLTFTSPNIYMTFFVVDPNKYIALIKYHKNLIILQESIH